MTIHSIFNFLLLWFCIYTAIQIVRYDSMHEWLDATFKKKVIHNCDGDPYLHRWYIIRTKRFGLFVHKFVRSDEDRALHDHPWNFLVIPIWQGYIEHSSVNHGWKRFSELFNKEIEEDFWVSRTKRVYPIVGTRLRKAEYRHRVELITEPFMWINEIHKGRMKEMPVYKPSWSIFFRFKNRREWGFWDKGVAFIHNMTWWKERC